MINIKEVDSIIRIPTSIGGNFFKYWIEFLKPIHGLTDRQTEVAVCLLKKRYELSKYITDDILLDKVLLSEDVRKEIRDECNITLQHYQVVLSSLRKSNIIIDNRINKRFIPNIKTSSDRFTLMLNFELNNV